jgi:peptide/nickel transport system substrate-binding protein
MIVVLGVCFLLGLSAVAQEVLEVAPDVPRTETLILENPEGRVGNPGRFNWWGGGGSWSGGLQQLALDTLWYIDPDAGIDGPWDNAVAAEKPIYNEDYTQMTVKLREGIYWSDGVEFTADDVIYTVETLMANPTMYAGGSFAVQVKNMSAPDKYTVVFDLNKPNSRFHALFTVRWCACFIMPKHIFEQQDDVMAFDFNPPVSLGAYVLKDYDETGDWFLWERREDWERTSVAKFGMPAPKYALYVNPGPSDKRVIAQSNHQLDVIHDLAPEGMIALAKRNPTSRGWFEGFPWAHPDPTLPAVILNNERPPLDNKDVRWALALAIDISQVSLASYKGAATLSAIQVPPTGGYLEWYFEPMEEWLKEFTIDVGDGEQFAPYNPDVALKIADMVRPSLGDQVPTDPEKIRKALGYGWWRHSPDMAEKLLLKNGFTRDKKGKWLLPDGTPWKIVLSGEGPARPIMNRAIVMIAEQWSNFGIDAQVEVTDLLWSEVMPNGYFDAAIGWNVETWGGHPDLFWFLESWHSDYYKPEGEPAVNKNTMRYKSPELDKIVEEIKTSDFDDPKGVELGLEFVKLMVEEMPTIPLMSYNVFTVCDEYYWEGFPTAENPYTNPVPNWANTKYMYPMIKPKAQ